MHELSIAHALIGLAREHVPDGARVRGLRVRVGPLQAISPQAMRFAWSAATEGTLFQGAELSFEHLPWILNCLACGRRWRSESWSEPCPCGSADVDPTGGDELTLLSIDVDDEPGAAAAENREPVARQGA